MAAHQAPPSLGFSRQEHWSGLPFPSPMHESEVAQSCLTLSDPMDCSPPGSSVHRIFQPRVLEWGATAFIEDLLCSSGDSTQCCVVTHVAVVLRHSQLFVTAWTVAHQAPLPLEFSRQEYWSGLPLPPPGDLPDPKIEPASPATSALQVDSLPNEL